MSSQLPTRFDNYPPEAVPEASGFEASDDLPRRALPPTSEPGVARRTVILFAIAAPALVGGLAVISKLSTQSTSAQPPPTASGSTSNRPGLEQVTVGGRYTVTVPEGWTYVGDGGGGLHFSHGVNRMSASGIAVPPSTRAVEELDLLARRHHEDFTGKINEPVDDSTDHVQRAHLIGSGKFQGASAILIAELWIDANGSGLLTKQLLTVSLASEIAIAAQRMVDELSAGF